MNDLIYWLLLQYFFVDIRIITFMRHPHGRHKMNVLYIVAGIISSVLLVYLMLALLKPEWFK